MIDETLIASLGVSDDDASALLTQAFGAKAGAEDRMESFLGEQIGDFTPGSVLEGKVIGFAGEDVVVEVGLKSAGLIPKTEFEDQTPKVGDKIKVLLEKVEGDGGLVELSK